MRSTRTHSSSRILIAVYAAAAACGVSAGAQPVAAAEPATTPSTQPAVSFSSQAFGHNFPADSGEVLLQLRPDLKSAGGQVRISDELGREMGRVGVPAGTNSVRVPLEGRGYYDIAASIRVEGGTELAAKTSASVVGPLLSNDVRLASPFGFFSVRGNTPLPVIAGSAWNRLFIPTNGVERSASGELKWWRPQPPGPKELEPINGEPAPLRWVGVFMFPPVSLVAEERRAKHNNHNVNPPVDWEGFREVVQFAAKHYAQYVDYFEPINEPDANWRGTEEELVRYHQVVAEAVHSVAPDKKVVGPCLCEIDMPRLRRLSSLGLFDHLDGLSIHAYANDAPPEGKWWASVRELRSFLRSIGKEQMPIVISEYGWQTAAGDWARPVNILSQARYAARSLTLLAAEDVDAINYFCLRYEDARIPFVQGWSVVEQDNNPRPAYAAIANVSRWLAGVEGRGTILRPAPDAYLALFKKGSGSVAVAWTVRGESSLQIPGHWIRASDMMGRPVSPDDGGLVKLSESPTFIELADGALNGIQVGEGVSVVRGGEVDLPGEWTGASLPAPLSIQNGRLTVPAAAAAGEYLVMAKGSNGTWNAAPVTVLPKFAIESAQLHWPSDRDQPVVQLQVRSHGEAVEILPSVRLAGAAPRFAERISVQADELKMVQVDLRDLPLGRRWTGTVVAEGRVDGRVESAEAPLDITLVPGAYAADEGPIDWSGIPVSRSRGWRTFGNAVLDAPLPVEDCSARLQWAWNSRGLHFRIAVQDNEHLQDREPAQMWQQDSLQFAFDVDADKPWQMNVNNDLVGLNGHRIFEYGVALRDGRPQTARWRETIVALPADAPPIESRIVREGTTTTYEVTFPWRVFALDRTPSAGTSIGFDLVINDADAPPSRRHGLEIFGGINSSKDPERFGRLLLRGKSE